MTTTDRKTYTDRDRYESDRNQALHNYERAVENAQHLYGSLTSKKAQFETLGLEIERLEQEHKSALERVEEKEKEMLHLIKTRRHFRDA